MCVIVCACVRAYGVGVVCNKCSYSMVLCMCLWCVCEIRVERESREVLAECICICICICIYVYVKIWERIVCAYLHLSPTQDQSSNLIHLQNLFLCV